MVRTRATATFPAEFTLVAAMNPCPCGYATSRSDRCTCQPAEVARYLRRVSGPLLDRIDLQVEVPAVAWSDLRGGASGPTSAEARETVVAARERAGRRLAEEASAGGRGPRRAERRRNGGGRRSEGTDRARDDRRGRPRANAGMGAEEVRRHCRLGPRAEALVRRGVEEHGLTARGYHRLLKVARTIADLEGAADIELGHVAEALQYRLPSRSGPD